LAPPGTEPCYWAWLHRERSRATELGSAWDGVVLMSLAPPGRRSRAIEFGSTYNSVVLLSLAPHGTEPCYWAWLHLVRSRAKDYFVKSFQNQIILWDLSRFRIILSKTTDIAMQTRRHGRQLTVVRGNTLATAPMTVISRRRTSQSHPCSAFWREG
jgi:hypothetical protein